MPSSSRYVSAEPGAGLPALASVLRCPQCMGSLQQHLESALECISCRRSWAIRDGTVRMVVGVRDGDPSSGIRQRTAKSFGYEWEHFGELRSEWHQNFLDYMRPHDERFFPGRLVLDVGTGSGRHARQAANLGAKVVAVDLGSAIDVARANLPDDVLTVQADAEALPLSPKTFDLVMSIGVLHHLPEPERAFRSLLPYVRPGGYVHVYLYWWPPHRVHRHILRGVTAVRSVTTRMPHRLLHVACYPLAVALLLGCVLPFRVLRRVPAFRRFADGFPLKTYADYPFGVLVNDQFDRFSAPIEHRYERHEVERLLVDAGLEEVQVLENVGWVASGRVPLVPEAA